jgi:monothiol glutaredoxin
LNQFGLSYKDIDILKDDELREAIKIFTDWPTLPQLYVKGQFIGGCDIVKNMYANGTLEKLLKENKII